MKPASAKKKGRTLQAMTVQLIRRHLRLLADDVRSVPSGVNGPDVWFSSTARQVCPYNFECKNQERLNVWTSLEQAEQYAGDFTPVLVFKRNRSDIYCSLKLVDFLKVLARAADV